MDDKLAILEVSKLSDILIVEGDPPTDLGALANVSEVFRGGDWGAPERDGPADAARNPRPARAGTGGLSARPRPSRQSRLGVSFGARQPERALIPGSAGPGLRQFRKPAELSLVYCGRREAKPVPAPESGRIAATSGFSR